MAQEHLHAISARVQHGTHAFFEKPEQHFQAEGPLYGSFYEGQFDFLRDDDAFRMPELRRNTSLWGNQADEDGTCMTVPIVSRSVYQLKRAVDETAMFTRA
ncbi:hypothetical protein AQ610_04745 [Burkholderia humptydooensis]|nr:hypothetical protein AQ610_04745 [Burkholderia humptydooensis]